MTYLSSFVLRNNIDTEIKNLSLTLKYEEIAKYNPLHYVFGHKLISKPWVKYGENDDWRNVYCGVFIA